MLPAAIAYTWLGYAGRTAVAGDAPALRYGLLGLAVLAMIAFVPRLFRRFRGAETTRIDAVELQRRRAAGGTLAIVDVRQPEEFMAPPGHLPDAVNIPLADIPMRARELADRRQAIVLVCKADRRSAQAAKELRAAG